MRTTVDIDPDLLKRLRDEAHESGLSVRTLLNAALRAGLDARHVQKDPPYRMPTFPLGPSILDESPKMLAIVDALADEELLRTMRRGV